VNRVDGRKVLDTGAPDHLPAVRADDGSGMIVGGKPILPLWLRSGVLAMLLVALLYALFGTPDEAVLELERGEPVASLEIRFEDRADGTVAVLDAADGREIARLAVGEDGFIRSVMRGLARERRAQGLGQQTPFRLTSWTHGFVSLEDPTTGRLVELTAFGSDNVAAFARLLGERAERLDGQAVLIGVDERRLVVGRG